jgi:hypothetical protein
LDRVTTSAELRQALEQLQLSQTEFARIVSDLAGVKMTGQNISQMCTAADWGRSPSATVRAVATMLLRRAGEPEASAAQALIAAGWTPPKP